MLRPLAPNERRRDPAYRVPWAVVFAADRRHVRARNDSADTLSRVVVTLLGDGELLLPHAALVPPGGAVEFAFPADAAPERAVALLAWTIEGEEYLYRVAR